LDEEAQPKGANEKRTRLIASISYRREKKIAKPWTWERKVWVGMAFNRIDLHHFMTQLKDGRSD